MLVLKKKPKILSLIQELRNITKVIKKIPIRESRNKNLIFLIQRIETKEKEIKKQIEVAKSGWEAINEITRIEIVNGKNIIL